ncbi:Hypothetical protein I595_2756 [Croceitalea dokdonensis DOKDO 023]|uniref:DUF1343 domain-containing protein n=1 Tax=Croceitalea dokdonensis DOKDO 023 TaxID=1300341 RepID=A0A0P7AUH1_9FLAO|nr:DUF1343 domain-containing protein [Croceitalea dokdonensis]KPM31489.1 Hypothetical protein I595_2756 [Croceitalea dokdonensis DOKDO 023]
MPIFSKLKSTVFCLSYLLFGCAQQPKKNNITLETPKNLSEQREIIVAANKTQDYVPMLKGKQIAVVANQTSVIFKDKGYTHLIDSLAARQINIVKVFAPEHGFRGKADAGELVKDGIDTKTGLPIVSLYGKNKKPSQEQLKGVDLVVFDIQDVGVRFYTYIATLQLVMEACATANIPVIVLDRPNPNGHYVDGPTMQAEHISFLGLQQIPLVYGMTIGEYATMINSEGWLKNGQRVDLTVVPLTHYTHNTPYVLPIRPSPNLPNSQSISLYPSLGLFEGTKVNAGRGTEFQFQRYGASFLDADSFGFSYVPQPNFGAKYPKEQGKTCFGEDLSQHPKMNRVTVSWLQKAYQSTTDKSNFFNTDSFTKHAGTARLQQQIENGWPEEKIRQSWQTEIDAFKKIRAKYLLYP